MAIRDILIYFYLTNKKDNFKVYQCIKNKIPFDPDNLKIVVNEKNRNDYCTIIDADYPKYLKQTGNPPLVIERGHKIAIKTSLKKLSSILYGGEKHLDGFKKDDVNLLFKEMGESLQRLYDLLETSEEVEYNLEDLYKLGDTINLLNSLVKE